MSDDEILIGPLKWKPKLNLGQRVDIPAGFTCGCVPCKVWFKTLAELREHTKTKHGAYKP